MKINNKVISIPPYISASWDHIKAIHKREDGVISIHLIDRSLIEIPNLNSSEIESIFHFHALALEYQEVSNPLKTANPFLPLLQNTPEQRIAAIPIGIAPPGAMEDFGNVMQHNSEQADMEPIPEEILQKIVTVTKALSPEGIENFPQPELHCNCVHCQIARAIHEGEAIEVQQEPIKKEELEEVVPPEELVFQQWEILQKGDQLFCVTNKLDSNEHYNVFLGDPVGCTCGNHGCEHIIAVLKS